MMMSMYSWEILISSVWLLYFSMRFSRTTRNSWPWMWQSSSGLSITRLRKFPCNMWKKLFIWNYWKYSVGLRTNWSDKIKMRSLHKWLLTQPGQMYCTCFRKKVRRNLASLLTSVWKYMRETNQVWSGLNRLSKTPRINQSLKRINWRRVRSLQLKASKLCSNRFSMWFNYWSWWRCVVMVNRISPKKSVKNLFWILKLPLI